MSSLARIQKEMGECEAYIDELISQGRKVSEKELEGAYARVRHIFHSMQRENEKNPGSFPEKVIYKKLGNFELEFDRMQEHAFPELPLAKRKKMERSRLQVERLIYSVLEESQGLPHSLSKQKKNSFETAQALTDALSKLLSDWVKSESEYQKISFESPTREKEYHENQKRTLLYNIQLRELYLNNSKLFAQAVRSIFALPQKESGLPRTQGAYTRGQAQIDKKLMEMQENRRQTRNLVYNFLYEIFPKQDLLLTYPAVHKVGFCMRGISLIMDHLRKENPQKFHLPFTLCPNIDDFQEKLVELQKNKESQFPQTFIIMCCKKPPEKERHHSTPCFVDKLPDGRLVILNTDSVPEDEVMFSSEMYSFVKDRRMKFIGVDKNRQHDEVHCAIFSAHDVRQFNIYCNKIRLALQNLEETAESIPFSKLPIPFLKPTQSFTTIGKVFQEMTTDKKEKQKKRAKFDAIQQRYVERTDAGDPREVNPRENPLRRVSARKRKQIEELALPISPIKGRNSFVDLVSDKWEAFLWEKILGH